MASTAARKAVYARGTAGTRPRPPWVRGKRRRWVTVGRSFPMIAVDAVSVSSSSWLAVAVVVTGGKTVKS